MILFKLGITLYYNMTVLLSFDLIILKKSGKIVHCQNWKTHANNNLVFKCERITWLQQQPDSSSIQIFLKKMLLGGKGDVNVDKFNVMLEEDVQVVGLFKTIEKTKCYTTNDFNFDLGLSRHT